MHEGVAANASCHEKTIWSNCTLKAGAELPKIFFMIQDDRRPRNATRDKAKRAYLLIPSTSGELSESEAILRDRIVKSAKNLKAIRSES